MHNLVQRVPSTLGFSLGLISCIVIFGGCAGPRMETIPSRPFISETDLKDTPQEVELIIKSLPEEVFKYDIYFMLTIEATGKSQSAYGSGQITMTTEPTSSPREISLKVTGEVLAGVPGQTATNTAVNCRQLFSSKGKLLATDCSNNNYASFYPFPEGPIPLGARWNELQDFYDVNIGKIQYANSYFFNKFTSIENRMCAVIDFEGKLASKIVSGKATVNNSNSKGSYYHDVELGLSAYGTAINSMEIFANDSRETIYMTTEIVYKLDYRNSILKRPGVVYATQPNKPTINSTQSMFTAPPSSEASFTNKSKVGGEIPSRLGKNMIVVSGTSANIRSGPGYSYAILATVRQGDKLLLIGESGDWFHVSLENGREGWIDNKFVK